MPEHEQPIPQGGEGVPEAGAELARLPSLWDSVYGQQPGFIALVAGVRRGRLSGIQEAFYPWPGSVAKAASWVRWQASQGKEVYHCGHLLQEPRRKKDAAAPLASLYADVDQAEIAPAVPEPTLLVESSPGKLQAYWRLTEPVTPARGEELNRRLALTLGADASGWDLTQLLRVPGTRNHKYPGAPLVRMLSQTAAVYDPDEFSQHLADVPNSAAQTAIAAAGESNPLAVRLTASGMAVFSGQDVKRRADGQVDRSASLVRIARVLFQTGMPTGEIAAALAERDVALGWEKYSRRTDALEQYQAIVAFVVRGARTRSR